MGSLIEELEAREVAARVWVEELEAEVAELAGKLELARESRPHPRPDQASGPHRRRSSASHRALL
ncbi:hypothetical protein OIE52_48905 [Streptomyces canus]|uniref:hypothetical protein n=1 Tax=Streptomyces canus TaxID=58343 RepID=UPI003246835E